MSATLLQGDALAVLATLPAGSVQTCVTSPPYYGLRDYGTAAWEGGDAECDHTEVFRPQRGHNGRDFGDTRGGEDAKESTKIQYRHTCAKCGAIRIDSQIGLEETPEAYIAKLVAVFREVRRVLADDGTLWVNIGDSYAANRGNGASSVGEKQATNVGANLGRLVCPPGYKPKDLIGIPWMLAFALRADGWYLRSEIIWAKPNPMPESVQDRPTKAHEQIFLLSKRATYYYDAEAVAEQVGELTRRAKTFRNGGDYTGGNSFSNSRKKEKDSHGDGEESLAGRNRRSVWTVTTQPYNGAKSIADYVDDDGIPYKASLDCPLHAHLSPARMSGIQSYGGQPIETLSRNPGNGNDPAAKSAYESKATIYHNRSEEEADNSPAQIPENTNGNRTSIPQNEHTLPAQSLDHNLSRSTSRDEQDYRMDSLRRLYSETASGRNKRKNKTARARQTSQRDNASAQTLFDIQSIERSDEHSDSVDHKRENSISEDALDGNQGSEKTSRNAHRLDVLDSFEAYKELYCTCEPVSIDHFATFPPKLIEPCILAGTSAKGQCPECGRAWARVTEHTAATPGQRVGYLEGTGMRNDGERAGHFIDAKTTTLGWQPQCDHDLEPVPQTVLDPFSGSGTTGEVALIHHRNYVGIELNPDYVKLSEKRLAELQPTLFALPARGNGKNA